MQSLRLTIDGMSCDHCVRHVRQALEHVDGVHVERVEIGQAMLTYDPQHATTDRILTVVADAGYTPHVRTS